MIREYKEVINSNFNGTVVDIETIGKFNPNYKRTNDSREYQYIQQVIFGFIDKQHLRIFCAEGKEAIPELLVKVEDTIDSLQRPLFAFNSDFERGVLFHQLGKIIDFEGELNEERYESKAAAVEKLDIPNYDDPFYDRGRLCMEAWLDENFDEAIAHNRACLLKERDILLKRRFRKPDELRFVSQTV